MTSSMPGSNNNPGSAAAAEAFQPPVFDPTNVPRSIAQRRNLALNFVNRFHSNTTNTTTTPASTTSLPTAPRLPRALPQVHQVLSQAREYAGPTQESNWVIPGRLMVGAYPASPMDDGENEEILRSILECGISTFVCLQQEYEHGAPEQLWREGKCLRPYIEDALEICQRNNGNGNIVPPSELRFLHHGIVDCGTTNDLDVLELAMDVCNRLLSEETIYLHCWGGHGRAGTVVAVVLGLLYGLPPSEALMRTQLYHDLRSCNLNVPSPQTLQQRHQVERILSDVWASNKYSHVIPTSLLPMIKIQPMSPQSAPSPKFEKEIRARNGWLGARGGGV